MTKKLKKELIEWGVIISIIAVVFATGLQTMIASTLQRAILYTGIIKPALDEEPLGEIDYNFSVIDSKGNEIPMETFRGKTIFINFWATWCPPCVAEMPDINNLYQSIDDPNVAFIMLSVDKDPRKAREFMDNKAYDLPLYFSAGPMPSILKGRSIPTTFVIDPNGKIIMKNSGMAQYDNEEFRNFLTAGHAFQSSFSTF